MRSLPQEIVKKLEELTKKIVNFGGITEISAEASKIHEELNEVLREVTVWKAKELDEEFFKNKGKHWRVVHKDVPRKILTEIGEIEIRRRYYESVKTGEKIYLVDEAYSLEKGSRIEKGFAAKIVTAATEKSYEKSGKIFPCMPISKQTTMNLVREANGYSLPMPVQREDVKIVHIQADEDHISLQNGSSTIVKYLALHETVKFQKKRAYLPEKVSFGSYFETPTQLWQRCADYINLKYPEDVKVYIHGDGARWIKTGLDIIPNSEYIMDRFHVMKTVNNLGGGNLTKKKEIVKYLEKADYETLKILLDTFVANDELSETMAEEKWQYLWNNRKGIELMFKLPSKMARSCAEGLVSHDLSERLSSRPRGWGEEGVDAVTRARLYVINGGKIDESHFKKETDILRTKAEEKKLKRFKKLAVTDTNKRDCHGFDIVATIPKRVDHRLLRELAKGTLYKVS